jgi:hypothetical protein
MISLEYGTDGFWNLLCTLGAIGVLALAAGMSWLVRRDRQHARKHSRFAWPQEGEVREVYVVGYGIKVHYLDSIWYSPFTNASGVHFNSSNINGLRHSIRACIKNPERFKKQFDALCADKIIVKLSERKAMSFTTNDAQPERRAS